MNLIGHPCSGGERKPAGFFFSENSDGNERGGCWGGEGPPFQASQAAAAPGVRVAHAQHPSWKVQFHPANACQPVDVMHIFFAGPLLSSLVASWFNPESPPFSPSNLPLSLSLFLSR